MRYFAPVLEATEAQLLEAAREGDAGALESLLRRHQDRIYRFGMKMCGHPEDAEDVLQETLLAAARSLREFRGGSSLSTWLYTIARSFCIKKRRKSKFAPAQEESLELEPADPGVPLDEAAAGLEIRTALEQAIAALDSGQREVLVLRDVEGLKATEVAEVLGIGVAAVKSRLHRARLRVREQLVPVLETAVPSTRAPGTCPDVLELYSKHLEGEIDADLCAEMERHIERCPRCRGTCDSLKETLALCQELPAVPVPADVQDSVRQALRAFLGRP